MGWAEAGGHQVDCVGGGGDEKEFEDGVVGRFGEVPEEVEVAGDVDEEVEGLRFEGDSTA